MKKFLINIYAYDYHGRFEVESNDDAISLEQAIVDKLGENSITWESTGMFHNVPYRITYEEGIDGNANTSTRPLHTKEGAGSRMGAGAS